MVNSMSYEIKKFGPDDISLAQETFLLFKKVFDGIDITSKELPDEPYLKHLLATPTFHMWGAMADNKIVGGLTAYEFEMYLKKEKEAYLYDLAVDEKYRRQGIARALVDAAKQYAKEHGVSTLLVEAQEEDVGAVEFYHSLNAEMQKVVHFNINTSDN
jgi:aminoglycoside 3-N-acetyltransferase I